MLKMKLKFLELEFEEEMKQKTERLKPRLLGCIWIDSKTSDCGMLSPCALFIPVLRSTNRYAAYVQYSLFLSEVLRKVTCPFSGHLTCVCVHAHSCICE
jgi:hypothetical protein